jgi:tetratricopeptide (TPR) repeat protein/tRNA A-37 threonylcarbamoyl transferase component Bud32
MASPGLPSRVGAPLPWTCVDETQDETAEPITADEETLPADHGTATAIESWPGMKIGRYVVRTQVGAGAMGVVLAAYDRELDREVALKLLKHHTGDGSAGRARLQREARALAKLDHPNVVGVHEIGVHDEQLYVAMEFVEGQTLGGWMRSVDVPRPWPEVVRIFMEAGRGLAAAHGAGLVHRDFKPDNVMLGADGRVRVMDFGLARADAESGPSVPTSGHDRASLEALTQTGTIVGTPAYMSPEQFGGAPADARSDQFSFCVALYEALYGERPFRATTLGQLMRALTEGTIAEAPQGSTVPHWLRKLVVRGLATSPEQRFESMSGLLDALADDPSLRRRRWWGAGLIAIAIAGSAVLTWSLANEPLASDVCIDAGAALNDVWNESRRAEARRAFAATELNYAEQVWTKIEARIDQYATAWAELETTACHERSTATGGDALALKRQLCLDSRLRQLDAVVERLSKADAQLVEHAVELTDRLPSLEACQDDGMVAALVEPPSDVETVALVEHAREQLRRAESHYQAHQYEASESIARKVSDELGFTSYWPIRAEAQLRLALAIQHTRNDETAIRALERAVELADAAGHHEVAAEALLRLTRIIGVSLRFHDRGHQLAARARAAVARLGGDLMLEAQLEHELGGLANDEHRYDEAIAHHNHAIALWAQRYGEDHPKIATGQAAIAEVSFARNNVEEGLRQLTIALETTRRALGPGHPQVIVLLHRLAEIEHLEDHRTRAHELYREALAVASEGMGPEDPRLIDSLLHLSRSLAERGEDEQALELSRRALAIATSNFGEEHKQVARTMRSVGEVLERLGRYEEAKVTTERARQLAERLARAGDHDDQGRGAELLDAGKYEEAIAHYQSLVAAEERVYGPDDPHVADALVSLSRVLAQVGRKDERRATLERAIEISRRHYGPRHERMLQLSYTLAYYAFEDERWLEAEQRFTELITASEQVYGSNHQTVGMFRNNLGVVEHVLGRYVRSLATFENLLDLYTREHTDNVDMIALFHQGKGSTLNDMGRHREAEREYAEVLAIHRGREEVHPGTLHTALTAHAFTLIKLGRHDEARAAYVEAAQIGKQMGGSGALSVATSDQVLATRLRDLGDKSAGLEPEQALIRATVEAKGIKHPDTAESQLLLVDAAIHFGEVGTARKALDRALPVLAATYGEGSTEWVRLAEIQALVAVHERDFEAALEHQRAALSRVEANDNYDLNYRTKRRVLLAQILALAGEHAEGDEILADTERETVQLYGATSPYVAELLLHRASSSLWQGRYAAAREFAERAIELVEVSSGTQSLHLHPLLLIEVQAALFAEDREGAVQALARLETLLNAEVTQDSVRWAELWSFRAILRAMGGEGEEATRDIERAEQLATQRLSRPEIILGTTKLARAELARARAEPDQARLHAEAARRLFAQHAMAPLHLLRHAETYGLP